MPDGQSRCGDCAELERIHHDVVRERDRLRAAIEDYRLWRPGERGHAAAHRKLMEALSQLATETCWCCLGYGTSCDECEEPTCTAAVTCRVCNGTKVQPAGTSMAENDEPPPAAPEGGSDA